MPPNYQSYFYYNKDNYESINLGSFPSKEQGPCVGFPGYEDRIKPMVDRWISKLKEIFSNLDKFGRFAKKKIETRYGNEWVAIFIYDKTLPVAEELKRFLKFQLPSVWEPEILEILFFPPSKDEDLDDWMNQNYGDEGGYPFFGK